MAETNINIHIKAFDEYSAVMGKVNGSIQKIQDGMHQASVAMRQTGREISRVGMEMAVLGGAITAPLILAYKDSAKYSASITDQIDRMGQAYQNIQRSIGNALIPVMERFIDVLNRIANAWNAWGQDKQEAFIQTLFKIGVALVGVGTSLMIFGKVVITMGAVIDLTQKIIGWFKILGGTMTMFGVANVPILLIVGAFIALGTAIWKNKQVADQFFNGLTVEWDAFKLALMGLRLGLEVLVQAILVGLAHCKPAVEGVVLAWADWRIGIDGMIIAFGKLFALSLGGLEKMFGLLSKLPEWLGGGHDQIIAEQDVKNARLLVDSATAWANIDMTKRVTYVNSGNATADAEKIAESYKKTIEDMANAVGQDAGKVALAIANAPEWKEISDIFAGQNSPLANAFDVFKQKVNSGIASIGDLKTAFGDFWNEMQTEHATLLQDESDYDKFWDGFTAGLKQTQIAMKNWADVGVKMAGQLYTTFSSTFDSMFNDAFQGNLKKASDYFKSWTIQIGQMFSKMLSQMLANQIMFGSLTGESGAGGVMGGIGGAIMSMFGGNKGTTSMPDLGGDYGSLDALAFHDGGMIGRYHSGGIIKAHSGLAVGEVPIIAQTGEGVLSRRGMANLAKLNAGAGGGGGGVTITIAPVITAWDATDVHRNRGAIVHAVAQDILNNGTIRQVIRRQT